MAKTAETGPAPTRTASPARPSRDADHSVGAVKNRSANIDRRGGGAGAHSKREKKNPSSTRAWRQRRLGPRGGARREAGAHLCADVYFRCLCLLCGRRGAGEGKDVRGKKMLSNGSPPVPTHISHPTRGARRPSRPPPPPPPPPATPPPAQRDNLLQGTRPHRLAELGSKPLGHHVALSRPRPKGHGGEDTNHSRGVKHGPPRVLALHRQANGQQSRPGRPGRLGTGDAGSIGVRHGQGARDSGGKVGR